MLTRPAVEAGGAIRLFKSHRAGIADGGQLRDFVHVDDAVSVVRWLLASPEVNGVFNVGSGKARSFADLAAAVFAAAQAVWGLARVAGGGREQILPADQEWLRDALVLGRPLAGLPVPAVFLLMLGLALWLVAKRSGKLRRA